MIYATIAALTTATIAASVEAVSVAGYYSPADCGGGTYVRTITPQTSAFVTLADGSKFELATEKANIVQFGAVSGSLSFMTENNTATVSAISYAKIKKRSVRIPTGDFYVNDNFVIDSTIRIEGDGDGSKLLLREKTGELFLFDLGNGGSINYAQFRDFAVHLSITPGVTAHTARAFRVIGTGDCYFQWALFENVTSYGFYGFFVSDASSHVTAFGNEGPVNWCRFENICFRGWNEPHLYGFMFNTGSGTGNEFHGCRGIINNWVWLYQAAGGIPRVVGDIVITGGQFGSYGGGKIFVTGANLQYRSRVRIQGLQADAGMSAIFSISPTGGAWNEVVADVTRGGGCSWGTFPTLTNSSLGFARTTVPAQ